MHETEKYMIEEGRCQERVRFLRPGKRKEEEAHLGIVDQQRKDLGRHRQGTAETVVQQLRTYSHQRRIGDWEGKGCFLGCRKH